MNTELFYCFNNKKLVTKNNILIKLVSRRILSTLILKLSIDGTLHPLPFTKKETYDILSLLDTFSLKFEDNRGKLANLEFIKTFKDIETVLISNEICPPKIYNKIHNKYVNLVE